METLARVGLPGARVARLLGLVVLLLALSPGVSSAYPISYEIEWDVVIGGDPLAYPFSLAGQPVPPPRDTSFTFDPATSLFAGFVVNWSFLEGTWADYFFDAGTYINTTWTASERDLIAAALISPGDNTWQGNTYSHGGPTISMFLDPSAGPFPIAMNWGPSFTSPECGVAGPHGEIAPTGCGVSGTYQVQQVPEPATLFLFLIGGAGLFVLSAVRRRSEHARIHTLPR